MGGYEEAEPLAWLSTQQTNSLALLIRASIPAIHGQKGGRPGTVPNWLVPKFYANPHHGPDPPRPPAPPPDIRCSPHLIQKKTLNK